MNARSLTILSVVLLVIAGCGHHDTQPPAISGATFSMDGTNAITNIGAPTRSTALTLPVQIAPTSSVLSLPKADSEIFAVAAGHDIIIGTPLSCHIFARSTDSTSIQELLADSTSIYAVHLDGTIESYTRAGGLRWHLSSEMLPNLHAVIASGMLLVSYAHSIHAFALASGSEVWTRRTMLYARGPTLDNEHHLVAVALTNNDPKMTDSIMFFDPTNGNVAASAGFPVTAITSDLCIDGNKIIFGYWSGHDTAAWHTAHVGCWSGLATGAAKQEWMHIVPYTVSSVSSNGTIAISGGFRESAGDISSGIDAFSLNDTLSAWHRRFTYPLVSAVTVSKSFAYIPFTFTTQAAVPTKTIVDVIDLTDGSTNGEVAVASANSGFMAGVAAPAGGAIVYADRTAPRVYFLSP